MEKTLGLCIFDKDKQILVKARGLFSLLSHLDEDGQGWVKLRLMKRVCCIPEKDGIASSFRISTKGTFIIVPVLELPGRGQGINLSTRSIYEGDTFWFDGIEIKMPTFFEMKNPKGFLL